MEWFLKVVRDNYANFNGRARRKEYWMYVLFNMLFAIGAAVIDYILGLQLIGLILGLALFIPSIAVAVRRLHDTNKSGWWLLLAFIPLANIALIVILCIDGTPGTNEYGPNPKEVDGDFHHSDVALDENV